MGRLWRLTWLSVGLSSGCTLSSERMPPGEGGADWGPVKPGVPVEVRSDGSPMQAFCERYAATSCSAMRSCCLDKGIGYDEASCEAGMLAGCRTAVQAVLDGEATFEPVAEECFEGEAELFGQCEHISFDERLRRTIFVFERCLAFRGLREPGETCRGHFDCAQPQALAAWAYCDGVCRVTRLVARGDACRAGEACVPGAYCRPRAPGSLDGLCQPILEPGQACEPLPDLGACGYGARCDPMERVCVTAAKLAGEACRSHGECISGSCDSALGFRCASAQPEVTARSCGAEVTTVNRPGAGISID